MLTLPYPGRLHPSTNITFFVVLSHHVAICVFVLHRLILDLEKKAYVFYGYIHGARHCASTLQGLNEY